MAHLPDELELGPVELVVSDAATVGRFYETAVGLAPLGDGEYGAGGRPLVRLVERADAPPAPTRSTGLFHLAILVPTRADLAAAIQRVSATGWRFTGASDHAVSEAMYLRDPENNGIELYRDRPREEWQRTDSEHGIHITTEPLDLDGVMSELPSEPQPHMREGTTMGHVHLQVSDLEATRAFYAGALGFDVTAEVPGAVFMAAGGYHHHLGTNAWGTRGAPAPPTGSRGLSHFTVVLPDEADVNDAGERAGGQWEDGDLWLTDPDGIRVRVVSGSVARGGRFQR